MSRWIDADAIDYKFEETFDEEKMEYLKPNTFVDGAVWVMRRIKDAPSIDIVRCKDCKWWVDNLTENDDDEAYDSCRWDWSRKIPTADDFCSYGEVE